MHILDGHLDAATSVLDESDGITDAIGETRIGATRLLIAALRGDEDEFSRLAEVATAQATARNEGIVLTLGEHARAVLNNGLSRYEVALAAAQSACEQDELDATARALPEVVEAATRCGRGEVAAGALAALAERTQAVGTDWALGMEARTRALVSAGSEAHTLYAEATERLTRCKIAPELARAHLLHGEWLRREGHRVEARHDLRTAYDMLAAIGMHGFAERARRELAATGEKVRRRQRDATDELTAQERQIAEMARDGHSNPQIATQLFVSPRTVEWHLRKVFTKLGVSSRRELADALPEIQFTGR
jgi:DNA-binding CsgD family transcriptional regulator